MEAIILASNQYDPQPNAPIIISLQPSFSNICGTFLHLPNITPFTSSSVISSPIFFALFKLIAEADSTFDVIVQVRLYLESLPHYLLSYNLCQQIHDLFTIPLVSFP